MINFKTYMWSFSIFVLFINLLVYGLIWDLQARPDSNRDHPHATHLALPVLHNITQLKAYQYRRITPIRINNSGGGRLSQCTASNLPKGLEIRISEDQATCELMGIPHHYTTTTEALIIALNAAGSSSIRVPITIHMNAFE